MKEIERLLVQLESHVQAGSYEPLESDKIEVKSLADGSDWQELYKSACAFMNTEGGMIVIGVKEKERRYYFTGYKGEQSEENKLRDLSNQFTDENGARVKLEEQFPHYEVRQFLDGKVCVIYVEKLPEEKKFVFYKQVAYCRKLTADEKIPANRIEDQNLYKQALRSAKELSIVRSATLEDLSVDKLNDYIIRLNKEIKIETLKADIQTSLPFLHRQSFIREAHPTLLGMLVCGIPIYEKIGGRCQVDAYVDSPIQIAQNKQIIKDNIFQLMEHAVGFVYKNIQVGVSYEKGGVQLPEYPEKLIRETVNNALAHRDYGSEGFVNIIIKPNQTLEIRNPGTFMDQQILKKDYRLEKTTLKIRRIIPFARARNPKLADILKTFDRWEGRGIGMATLTNACLENEINVPYFILRPESVSLFVPKGKVLDATAELWLNSFESYITNKNNGRRLSVEARSVLAYYYKSEKLNREEKFSILLTQDNNHFSAIADLEEAGLLIRLDVAESIYPVYVLDRILAQTDFSPELAALFGPAYGTLSNDYQEVLEAIWLFNAYGNSNKQVSANLISTYIFSKRHSHVEDIRMYENFKRKVRNIVATLEKKGMIVRKKNNLSDFKINDKFIN